MEGNEAVARGAVAAGCRFFAGYPITPATTILNNMLALLPPVGGICLQCEDEIASIGACLGASMSGLKVMTATSGPGISLYSEHISFAVGSEIPIVIVDVQRLGPSTGSATRGADGDINFMRWGNSGGLPVIVLAPVDVADCYQLTFQAFNLAEKFRCPVFVASNKEIAMTRESIDMDTQKMPVAITRQVPPGNREFLPFQVDGGREVPDFLPIGGDVLVRQTSSTHGVNGYITTDHDEIAAMIKRLKSKIHAAVDEFSYYDSYTADKAKTLVISYGVSSRAARAVFNELRSTEHPVSLLVLKTIWPVAEKIIRRATRNIERVVVIEMNMGQYVYEIQRIVPNKPVELLAQMDGRLITPRAIKEKIIHG
jgi:2-oxoglutarate ferredoxin oxidoreductase subunit alpha